MRMLLILVLFLLPPLSLANTEEELRNIETLNLWGDIWINKQYGLIEELVNPVYIRHEPSGTVHVKREDYLKRLKTMQAANRKFTTQTLSADGDLIWVRWSMTRENPETKEISHSRGLQVYRFEDGKLAETWWSHNEGQGAWLDL
ncbi:nuclear transport factor 2 family protein [Halieaceae bacterium IMCC14734]|uniref:Nuclear transport factor 2 family protein n=1 Tax=Candidatus Litorirhabdus singularis TaxID=2518993 RepID=A0ABT3TP13_9GAMM|nr:nuclear transport factor 2 family protein [Candidatus Litorirhabdus singularis]MCX2983129.1 nuclear transport factor 2 family protein [Candidatus Litorirhabdus singularis]